MWYLKLQKTFISRHVLHQHWYTCPIVLTVRRNPQHRSLLTVVSATCVPLFQRHRQRNVCHPVLNSFIATNTSHRKQKKFLYEYPLHGVLLLTRKRTARRCSSVIYSSSTVAILSTETSLWTCTCASATYTGMKVDSAVTSITAVLLPFVTYLPTLSYNLYGVKN
jgi:hypothetical protein